jgi:hypothetical protein
MTTTKNVEVCPVCATEVVRVRRADTGQHGRTSGSQPLVMALKLFWTCNSGHEWSEEIVSGEAGSRREIIIWQ